MIILTSFKTIDGQTHGSRGSAESHCCAQIDALLRDSFLKATNADPLDRKKLALYFTENPGALRKLAQWAQELEAVREGAEE